MSAALTLAPTVWAPAVPASFVGQARQLRRDVEREDAAVNATVNRLFDPIVDRLKRCPGRSVRQELLNALATGWLTMPAEFRLSCDAKLDKAKVHIVERRLVAGRLQRPDWNGDEPDLGVTVITLTIAKGRASLKTRCLTTFSIHALARRLQRGAEATTEALLADIALAADAASGTLTVGAGYSVVTDADGGGWRGRAISIRDVGVVLGVRTWLGGPDG